ncbi:translation initiation factor IF-2 [Puteibacter caeruleilacunae]|nr:translation initiation factor IF-2 [Puteibacter caeruleilacunae]
MVTGKNTKRLSKIAREFNVGITTIVDFLNKKGIETSSNPNNKISEEAYNLISKEFSKDISLKKESEKLNLRSNRGKHETISIEDSSSEEKANEKPDPEDKSVEKTVTNKEKSTDEIYRDTPKVEKVKVVGKIDLNPPKPKPEPKVEEKKVEKVVKVEKKVEKKVEEKKKVVVEKQPKKPVAEEPKKEIVIEKKIEHKKEAQRKPEEEKPMKTEVKAKAKDGGLESNVPKIEEEIKVVGKIDLSSLNQKTRPAKKTRKQREEERAERARNERKQDNSKEDKVFSVKKKKLSGPTVLGKIELPEERKKKPVASSSDSNVGGGNKKKRRKRIQKDGKERVNVGGKQQQQHPQHQNKPGEGRRRPNKPVAKRKKVVKKEVSEEDVQKQIKDTLARLTSKGKSKGSKHRRDKRQAASDKLQAEQEKANKEKNIIKVTEFVSVNELASMMNVQATNVIASCMSLGLFVSINQRLDAETMALVADEFGYKVEFISVELQESIAEEEDSETDLQERPPIVTVMGHVDHGKTSLLDYVRHANVIAGEAGGITQHIGAYNVKLDSGRKITFLDTPGHEAFTAMRARGAQVTDIAIIIVAADDNVMPQTVEAINHATAAGVPIVFAINKIDKPGANPDKIKESLAAMNYLVEEWGGKYQSHDISAKNGIGIDELLEKVLLEAEMLELKANPDKRAIGSIVESSLDKGRGYVSTVLVQAGTLKIGDVILAGQYFGHVKAMFNERNQPVKEAGPAEPVLILGLNGAPQAGDQFNVMEAEREARQIANKREQLQREQGLRTQKHITLDEIGRRIAIGNFQELNVIVKGDVDGSIEALSDSLIKLSTEEIQVNVIHKAVGQISESDVMLATASEAIIIGFQVRPSMGARKIAEKEEIDIRLYSIIYDAIEELKSAMEGMLSPDIKEEITSTVEVMETFKISKVGTIAGCIVRDGKIKRNSKIRVIRDGIVVYTGTLGSLKRFKDDVKEVARGFECGLNVENYNDIKVGDMVEGYEEVEVSRKL